MSSQPSLSATAPPAVVAIDENSSGDDSVNINSPNRWFFDKEKLESTPSRKCGIDSDKELTYRQQSANFIQDIGQRLQVNQLCINTAIVYMHRFYMFHSFSHFHRNAVSTASIFLAAKVEEQPRKLEHVIKVAHYCLHRETQPQIDTKSEQYVEQSSELVMNENVLLQTLGFDVAIDHPHTHVVKCCQLVRASKDLAQTSYFMATNSLHLTTMCLQYKPTVVACVCIHLACKWSNWEIPRSKEGKDWFLYVDDTVTTEQLESMTTEFLTIFNKSPSRLKKKMMSLSQVSGSANLSSFPTHLGLDPTSPGAPNFPKSRSPSPAGSAKRAAPSKPSGSQQLLPGKSAKPHGNLPSGHHGMKPMAGHHGSAPNLGATKHVHPSTGKPAYHVSHPHGYPLHSAKDVHQQNPQSLKDGHQPPHGKHPNAMHHGHGIPPPYPHGTRPNAQQHHSQSHPGQKPLPPGAHQSHPGYSSKIPPLHPSKSQHAMNVPKSSALGSGANKPGMASHPPTAKKPYHEGYGSKEELHRRSNPNPNQQQQRPRPSEKPDMRHHSQSQPVPGGQLPNAAHQAPHAADHSRSWTEHASSFGYGGDASAGRSEKPNPALASKNAMSADYYQRHRTEMGEKRVPGVSGQGSNNLSQTSLGNAVDRNDNLSITKIENMEEQFNQIVSKVNANNSYYPVANSTSGSVNADSNVPLYKSKQGSVQHGAMSSIGELAGFVKNEEEQNQIPPAVALPDNKNKRRHTEGLMDIRNPTSSKRPRSDAHATLGFTSLSEDMIIEPKKILNPKSSPPQATRDSRRSNAFQKGTHLAEATPFGNEMKSDMSKLLLPSFSMELQPPELIEPLGDSQTLGNSSVNKSQNLSRGSIFSPKLSDTPQISSIKQEGSGSAKSLKPLNNALYFSSSVSINNNSGHNGAPSITANPSATQIGDATLSSVLPDAATSLVPKPLSNEASSSEHHKKSKKSKKEKHKHKDKHKDKEEKKHKKDKHRDKDREKHKSRDKRRSVDVVETPEVKQPPVSKLKISIGGPEKHGKEKESKSKHSSSTKRASEEYEEARTKVSSASLKPTPSGTLKVKIVNKERVRSMEEEPFKSKSSRMEQQNQHSQGQSTPCCPGFGPCTNPNCNQSQGPIKVKIPKEKITGASTTARPKETKETKKSKKEKEPKHSPCPECRRRKLWYQQIDVY